MVRYVGFLRGINLGGRTVKMDRLRAVVAGLGHTDVETFIASGNVVFTAEGSEAAVTAELEAALDESFGFAVPTMLRTTKDLATIAGREPFGDVANLYVSFTRTKPDAAAVRRVMSYESDIDQLRVTGREVYWGCAVGQSQSTFTSVKLDRALGQPATTRNITTLRKMAAKYPPG